MKGLLENQPKPARINMHEKLLLQCLRLQEQWDFPNMQSFSSTLQSLEGRAKLYAVFVQIKASLSCSGFSCLSSPASLWSGSKHQVPS